MTPFLLRPGTIADVPAMHALDMLCFAPPFRFDRPAMKRFAAEPGARTVLAEVDGTICGFVLVTLTRSAGMTPSGYITTLDVHPEHRRQGIAQALMAEAEFCASKDSASTMLLHVYVENEPAILFYEHEGYERLTRHTSFYGKGMDAWEYTKLLD